MAEALRGDQQAFFPSLSRLRAFSTAARLGSITRAAQELRRSQSAVTQAIKNFENDLGVELLKRTRSGAFLTEMGEILALRTNSFFAILGAGIRQASGGRLDEAAVAAFAQRVTRSQLIALTVVHEYGSLSQAARHVNIAVASLHHAAHELEKQLGLTLFENTAHGLLTNAMGAELSRTCSLARRELEAALEEIRSRAGVLRGRLLVGAPVLGATNFAATAIDKFIRAHPQVRITAISGFYDDLLGKLRWGEIDFLIGILKIPAPVDDVIEKPLAEDPYVIAVSSDHPLAGRRPISREELQQAEWIAPPVRRIVLEELLGGSTLLRLDIEISSITAIYRLLMTSHRMALLTRSELALDQFLGNHLTALDYPVGDPVRVLGVTVRKDWQPTALQQVFLDFLESRRVGI